MQLGLLPALDVRQTSKEAIGQVYVPQINWLLMVCVIALVVAFGSSDNLAAAYGIAVAGTMVITTCLLAVVARQLWRWSLPVTIGVIGFFWWSTWLSRGECGQDPRRVAGSRC